MDAIIKKNSTQTLIVDPRLYTDSVVNWNQVLENAVVTFSLYDVETGCYVVASRAGEIIPGGLSESDEALTNSVSCGDDTTVSRIAYRFRSRDTKTAGVYLGTFQVNVIGEDTTLAVPSAGDIQVVITESGIAPWTQATFTGMAEIPDAPTDAPELPTASPWVAGTWFELEAMRSTNQLIQGVEYLLTDYQTIHRVPGLTTINTGPIEPLVLQALSPSSFSIVAKSTLYPMDTLHYEFQNEYVRCEDSFDADIAGASQSCVNDNSVHRPGYIIYREDTKNNLSAHYDFRAFINRIASVTGFTFANGVTDCSVGRLSGNIRIVGANNVRVGANTQGIYITRVAQRIRIGDDVRGFSTSGQTLSTRYLPNSVFELNDSGIDGFAKVVLRMSTGSFAGTNRVGFLPAGCFVSGLEIINQGLNFSAGAAASMGIDTVDNGEIFSNMPLADIASGVFTAQVNTRAAANSSFVTMSLTDAGSIGNMHVKTMFVNTGGGVFIPNVPDEMPDGGGETGGGGSPDPVPAYSTTAVVNGADVYVMPGLSLAGLPGLGLNFNSLPDTGVLPTQMLIQVNGQIVAQVDYGPYGGQPFNLYMPDGGVYSGTFQAGLVALGAG